MLVALKQSRNKWEEQLNDEVLSHVKSKRSADAKVHSVQRSFFLQSQTVQTPKLDVAFTLTQE